jgi:hypothetical protein
VRLNSITGGDKEKQDGITTVLSNWDGKTGQISNLLIQDLKEVNKFVSLNTGYFKLK